MSSNRERRQIVVHILKNRICNRDCADNKYSFHKMGPCKFAAVYEICIMSVLGKLKLIFASTMHIKNSNVLTLSRIST